MTPGERALLGSMLCVGAVCEVLPAYSSETGSRSIWDEIAGAQAIILAERESGYCDVRIGDEEHEVFRTRLRRVR